MADLFRTFIDLFVHPGRHLGDILNYFGIFIFGGYFFGNLPIIKNNFTLVIIAIIILSVMPGVIEYFRQRRETA